MAFVYIVRCRFTAPAKEQAWNAWYSGPKMAQMLGQPHFRSCQRFRRAWGGGRDYLALWTVDEPEALATPQYVSQWGFAEWVSLVTDWSRDLFDGSALPDDAFEVTPRGGLVVVSFESMSAEDANEAHAIVSRADPAIMWLPVIGLDRHTPTIGLKPMPTATPPPPGGEGLQLGVYRPITEYNRAARLGTLSGND
jgi:hypothetical protein